MGFRTAVLACLVACAPPVLEIDVASDPSGLVVRGNQPLEQVEVRRGGTLLTQIQVRPATDVVLVRLPPGQGGLQVRTRAGLQLDEQVFVPPNTGPVRTWLEIPMGQGALPPEAVIELPRGAKVRGGLVIEAQQDRLVSWSVDGEEGQVLLRSGERRVVVFPVRGGVHAKVWTEGWSQEHRFEARMVAASAIAASIDWGVVFPANPDGTIDRTAPASRIVLPSPWWDRLLDRLGLGFRARDDQAPRGRLGVWLHNRADVARNLVLVAKTDAPAFRPRLRDETHLDRIARTVRLPAHSSVYAALPVYLDRSLVPETLVQPIDVELRLLGSETVLATQTLELVVERGSRWASAVAVLGAGFAIGGWSWMALSLGPWMRRPTRELTMVAMFGALSFTVGAASQIVGLGVGSVLGPFAPFVIGLGDDALRMCLAAALVSLIPQVGVASLALLLGWLMRAVVLGAAHPVDVLYLGSAVLLAESFLYLSGITRGVVGGSKWGRWLRLCVGLAVPHAFGALFALAISSVVYRLFYAELYVAAVVALPGFLYAVLGCALAVPFAERVSA